MTSPVTLEAPLPVTDGCLHCGLPLGHLARGQFCCHGCQVVHALLQENQLGRYYQLRQGKGTPVADLPKAKRDLSWLHESLQENKTPGHLRLDLQGIHCSGCIWILEKTFKQNPGAQKILVNPAIGTIDIWFQEAFAIEDWIRSVERFGYRFGPALKSHDAVQSALLIRLGICIAIAFNVMLLSAALYFGLSEGRIYNMVRWLSFGLAGISVVVGGPVFFRSALAGLRNQVLHLDVPISLGIILAFAGSSWAFVSGRDNALYLDSVSVFIALMLLGRYLQERVLSSNRNRLLANDGTHGLRSKRIQEDQVQVIKSQSIEPGYQLLIASGDLIPVRSRLLSDHAAISTDWINGESSAKEYREGELLEAGSFNAGTNALRVKSIDGFSASPLENLLRPSHGAHQTGAHESGFLRIISIYYVAGVLIASFGGFALWLALTHELARSLEIATAVLVVTCPCAFGIATPLAHEIVQSQLRKLGLYVRAGDFLHRASSIKKIVFDKTGTVTTGSMKLDAKEFLQILSPQEQQVLYDLSARSTHPTSVAIFDSLQNSGHKLGDIKAFQEIPGQGIECQQDKHSYKLGRGPWALNDATQSTGTIFSKDGKKLASFTPKEETRPDVKEEIQRLNKQGYEIFILSGDTKERVSTLAQELGIAPSRAIAEHNPQEKEAWLQTQDHGDLLFIGDGINDSLAAKSATCSGTPALDRPFMASHCDFYLGTNRIAPIRFALMAAKQMNRVIRKNLAFALFYNAFAISLAWAGFMQPWLAAILMPTSSIIIVLATVTSLSGKTKQWMS